MADDGCRPMDKVEKTVFGSFLGGCIVILLGCLIGVPGFVLSGLAAIAFAAFVVIWDGLQ